MSREELPIFCDDGEALIEETPAPTSPVGINWLDVKQKLLDDLNAALIKDPNDTVRWRIKKYLRGLLKTRRGNSEELQYPGDIHRLHKLEKSLFEFSITKQRYTTSDPPRNSSFELEVVALIVGSNRAQRAAYDEDYWSWTQRMLTETYKTVQESVAPVVESAQHYYASFFARREETPVAVEDVAQHQPTTTAPTH